MTTPTLGSPARLFPWNAAHYVVHGGPNDPVTQTNVPPTSGGYFSWNSQIVVPPLEGPLIGSSGGQAGASVQQWPRPQSLQSAGTFGNNPSNNTGGIYIGTLPQGAWLKCIEAYQYVAFTVSGGAITGLGVFYAPAGSYSLSNNPGYQPTTLWEIVANNTGGAANTLYSTQAGGGRVAWTNSGTTAPMGPGTSPAAFTTGAGPSLSDVDLYLVLFATGTPTAGCLALLVEYDGPQG